ncbi:hypothetical protein KGF56_001666 [Candida oxycetoniae]|uniref:DUF676 domain-containing protein n=1 Tax=Candida oxycetoniae TaxID=497107 RepID=A0AAI9WYZ1_9ASCO|nr:uncharacterized protein KGF56_001666 [Candida oxycetoniae]KAI3405648.2 hypothetical protein KGF56_001666 [Candida oxycetoniae]
MAAVKEPYLWYRDKDSLKIGEVNRYVVRYARYPDHKIKQIYFRLKNIENTGIRTVHLISGPFILYCHVIPCNYNSRRKFVPDNAQENPELVFENQIKPNQTFTVTLLLNKNSLLGTAELEDEQTTVEYFQWEIDVISQIVITRKTTVDYDMMIGDDLQFMKKLTYSVVEKAISSIGSNSDFNNNNNKAEMKIDQKHTNNHVFNPSLSVMKKNTEDIWNSPPSKPLEPVHLIIVTHGIFSNLTADMLYLKDVLELKVKENIMVRGFRYNAGRTEKGIRKLGINVANFIVDLVEKLPYRFDKISFIAHSLGGVVQLYAIKYILLTRGVEFFKRLNIEPVNLISLASPFLGILNELNFVISWFLDLGTLGKTGRDLTLSKHIPTWKDIDLDDQKKRDTFKPVLETLPNDPLQTFLGEFKRLTVYANAINDGIVPLRTAALLYLDYEALGDVNTLKRTKHVTEHPELENDHNHDVESIESGDTVSEVPDDEGHTDAESLGTKNNSNEKRKLMDTSRKQSNQGKHSFKFATHKYFDFLDLSSPGEAKKSRRQKRYRNFTIKGSKTLGDDENEEENNEDNSSENSDDSAPLIIPPRASAIESALNTLICPIPSNEFIMEPESRHPVIFHDRYYRLDKSKENEGEKENEKLSWFFEKFFKYRGRYKLHKQVVIANKYHTDKLTWRKVLVNLPPDAHNNIIVRRRFANGYGWGVINHLCENLFECKGNDETEKKVDLETSPDDIKAKI